MMKMLKILVAEDNPNLARYYEMLLGLWNCETVVEHSKGEDARMLAKFCRLFSHMGEGDRGLVLFMAQKMARQKAV